MDRSKLRHIHHGEITDIDFDNEPGFIWVKVGNPKTNLRLTQSEFDQLCSEDGLYW